MLNIKIEATEVIPKVPHKYVYFIEVFVKDITNPALREIALRITDAPANKESCQPNFTSIAKEKTKVNRSVNTDISAKLVKQKALCDFSSTWLC